MKAEASTLVTRSLGEVLLELCQTESSTSGLEPLLVPWPGPQVSAHDVYFKSYVISTSSRMIYMSSTGARLRSVSLPKYNPYSLSCHA